MSKQGRNHSMQIIDHEMQTLDDVVKRLKASWQRSSADVAVIHANARQLRNMMGRVQDACFDEMELLFRRADERDDAENP